MKKHCYRLRRILFLGSLCFASFTSGAVTQSINLLPNSSFEAAFDAKLGNGWGGFPGGQTSIVQETIDEGLDVRPFVDAMTAANGRQSLRLELPARSGYVIASPLIASQAGRAYTASIALKSTAPVNAKLALVGTEVIRNILIGSTWQRYIVSGVAPQTLEGMGLKVELSAPAEGSVMIWLDAAQIEEGVLLETNYRAPHPAELALQVPQSGSIIHDGQAATIRILTAGALPDGARLKLRLSDLYGRALELPDVILPVTSLTLPAEVTPQPRGLFKLRGWVVDSGDRLLAEPVEVIFARLPRPRELAAERSYFGVHAPLSRDWLLIARALGARWVRLHDASKITKWRIVEDVPGAFRHFDEGVNLARELGLMLLGTLDGAPPWASLAPQATEGYLSMYNLPNAPGALKHWSNYVADTVSHYTGRIDHWEVWNEPWHPIFFPGGTPEFYGELLRLAQAAAKQANPRAIIVGIDTDNSADEFTRRALAAAGPSYYDIFSFHEYNSLFFGGPENIALARAQKFGQMQQSYGAPRPLWITEGGPSTSGMSCYNPDGPGRAPRQQIAHAVRLDVSLLTAGVQKFFHYTLEISSPPGSAGGLYETLEYDRAPRALLVGRAVLASLIDGAQPLGRTEPAPGVDAYSFQQDDGRQVTVLWSYDGQEHSVTIPRGFTALDALGNMLTESASLLIGAEPIYLAQVTRARVQRPLSRL